MPEPPENSILQRKLNVVALRNDIANCQQVIRFKCMDEPGINGKQKRKSKHLY